MLPLLLHCVCHCKLYENIEKKLGMTDRTAAIFLRAQGNAATDMLLRNATKYLGRFANDQSSLQVSSIEISIVGITNVVSLR